MIFVAFFLLTGLWGYELGAQLHTPPESSADFCVPKVERAYLEGFEDGLKDCQEVSK